MSSKSSIILAFSLMAIAAFSRLIPHMPNFTAVEGLTLFGAAFLGSKRITAFYVLAMLWITDFVINNTIARAFFTEQEGMVWFSDYMIFNAVSVVAIVFVGSKFLAKITPLRIGAAGISSTLIFFIVTNFGAWISNHGGLYSKDLNGLMQAFVAGLPFLRTSIISTLVFCTIIFGAKYLIEKLISNSSTAASRSTSNL
ncbi:MAG: DUF6580 family putative transport protein [Saprospiraceae bacterium]